MASESVAGGFPSYNLACYCAPAFHFHPSQRETANETGRTSSSSTSDLLCIGKGPFAGRARVVTSPRTVIDVFSIRRTRALVPTGASFPNDDSTSGTCRGHTAGFDTEDVLTMPRARLQSAEGRSGRKRNRITQADVVDEPACPSGDTQVHPGTVMVSRLCERAKNLALCPHTGPLRDELVKFIESAKLGGEGEGGGGRARVLSFDFLLSSGLSSPPITLRENLESEIANLNDNRATRLR